MPNNKRIAFWGIKKMELDEKESYFRNYFLMATMVGDRLIVGGAEPKRKRNGNLYAVDITPKMAESEFGLEATPQLLLKNAFEKSSEYPHGNPITVIPIDDLEGLINKSKEISK